MVQIGSNVKAKNAAKWESDLVTDLHAGETIWAFATLIRFRPSMVDALAFTNRRIIGFASYSKPGAKVKVGVDAAAVRGVEIIEKFASNKLNIVTDDGPVYFGEIVKDDFDFIRYFADELQQRQAVLPEPARVSLDKPKSPPADATRPHLLSDEIARLADMHQKGWLDDEEFRAAKRAVISRMS